VNRLGDDLATWGFPVADVCEDAENRNDSFRQITPLTSSPRVAVLPAMGAPAIGAPARALPLQFTGRGSEYFRIWIIGVALSLFTLGIYSAWAKVRTQQYFYRHTWLDGASFEYLAEPRELLRGRLLLAGVLAFCFAVQVLYAPASVLVLPALLAVSPWIIVRSVGFRARNSAFRNIRFGLSSRLGVAYATFFKGYLQTLVSFGLAYPDARWRRLDHVVQRLRYGSAAIAWRTPRSEFYSTYLRSVLLILPAFAIISLVRRQRFEALSGTPALLATYGCAFLATIYLRTRSENLIYGGVQIGPHRLRSAQRFWPLLGIYVTNTLAVVVTLGLAIPWAKVRLTRYRVEALTLEVRGGLEVTAELDPANRRGYGDAAADLGGIDLGIG
jgi:uncharacterized membrane protein YjgN (DUF898 family)